MTVFLAKSIDGELNFGSPFNVSRLKQHLKENDGKLFRVERQVENRTGQQNRYMWMYFDIVAHETGNLTDDIYEFAKRKFITPRYTEIVVKGVKTELKLPAKTSKLSKVEMSDFLDKCSAYFEVPLPDPTLLEGFIQG